jgi:NADH-quinone oxidoreductase subunit L
MDTLLSLLWLVPALPLAGFLVLALVGGRLGRGAVAWTGVGSVGAAFAVALAASVAWASSGSGPEPYVQVLWRWMEAAGFRPEVSLSLDSLSVVMILVVTGVGFLIHLYSAEFMTEDDGYARFFAYMNLFVGSMLVLVLAGNLLVLYMGWEGVGLCSYLLIGFWYADPANGAAARKAFIVTRVGDAALAIGLFLILSRLGTLDIATAMDAATREWPLGSGVAVAAAALLLGGAVGKSAQLPLQTWLPDAMAGPTPVSALIHAATMVTAGVYLIARTHALFLLAPVVMTVVAAVGALTLLISGFSALFQRDIKRILAYSTISQIGYMFLALGVGVWSGAIFHLMTHAFFKALLFLGAGVVIMALDEEHDIFRMGGLRTRLPGPFWAFLAASLSLAAFPLVTAGFYSKEAILWGAWNAPTGGPLLWAAGLLGAFLTALYIFRLVFVVFFGEKGPEIGRTPGGRILLPLGVLAVLSIVGGFVEVPGNLGGVHLFSGFLAGTLPAAGEAGASHAPALEWGLQLAAVVASLLGITLAWVWYHRPQREAGEVLEKRWIPGGLRRFWFGGWGFDVLYDRLLVAPYTALARWGKDDVVDLLFRGLGAVMRVAHELLVRTQTGRVRWYARGVVAGAVLLLGWVLLS